MRKEQVLENWSILIKGRCSKAESIFEDTRSFLEKSKVESIDVERKKMAPGLIRGV